MGIKIKFVKSQEKLHGGDELPFIMIPHVPTVTWLFRTYSTEFVHLQAIPVSDPNVQLTYSRVLPSAPVRDCSE